MNMKNKTTTIAIALLAMAAAYGVKAATVYQPALYASMVHTERTEPLTPNFCPTSAAQVLEQLMDGHQAQPCVVPTATGELNDTLGNKHRTEPEVNA
jgi:Spy/CpxP family protein refolding chaperone